MGLVLGTITFLIHVNNSQGKLKMGQYINREVARKAA
jgi:hypothetical protein